MFLRLATLALSLFVTPTLALAQGYLCAEGGGNANKGDWTDEVFGWMVEKGNRGHIVIIGALEVAADDTRGALFKRLGAASASNIMVNEENADSQEVFDEISRASVVWIKGGDQGRYVKWWKGTKAEQAIRAVFARGGVVGGTSAGCAVLGEWTYSALNDSLHPLEALADARHPDLTLEHGFLGLAPGVIFDTHFTERGRIARLPVLLAHIREQRRGLGAPGPTNEIIGIGVDPRTAVCISPDGRAEVRGEGTITIMSLTPATQTVIGAGKPPVVTDVQCERYAAGYHFNIKGDDAPPAPPSSRARRTTTNDTEPGDIVVDVAGPAPATHSHHTETRVWSGKAPDDAIRRAMGTLTDRTSADAIFLDEGAKARIREHQPPTLRVEIGNGAATSILWFDTGSLHVLAPGWECRLSSPIP